MTSAHIIVGQAPANAGTMQLILLGGMVLVFYFFMIRPQNKKNKEQKAFRESIGKGDRIVTIGGVHGKIVETDETTVIIEVEGQNRLKIERSAISAENTAVAYPAEKK